jgi:hypothetical protein
MKVKFRQSGGFGGLVRGCEVDTQSLAAPLAKKLESLVQPLLERKTPKSAAPPPGSADLTNYEIEIEAGGKPLRIVADDLSIPPAVEPLLDYLRKQAKPEKLK